ncbi:MAG: hypothetical protein GQ582_00775 [Methyloprofundus sp.]|nr:hypothetical protein [Methyloprofundus sp.]
MFKRTKIAAVTAAVLGLSSMAAQAVTVNENAADGQVLIFPYYNVNNGFTTNFNIINTTDAVKAVKIRFRESHTSNDVLDFNLYMSPRDVFVVGLAKNDEGGVTLTAPDTSCTHPAIPPEGVAFRDVYDSVDAADMLEGYLEVIEMGEIDPLATVSLGRNIVQSVTHVDGVPADCSVISDAWQEGIFIQGGAQANSGEINVVNPKSIGFPAHAVGGNGISDDGYYGRAPVDGMLGALTGPTGGLVGSSVLIDFERFAGFVAEPISVTHYATLPQHYLSSDENFYLLPSLASGDVYTADFLSANPTDPAIHATWSSVVRDFGLDDINVLPRTSVPSGINPMPMADALAVVAIGNQYFLDPGVSTDWVMATPMRKHAIFNDYKYIAAGVWTGDALPATDIAVGMTASTVEGERAGLASANGYWKFMGLGDIKADFKYWDREEGEDRPEPGDFSPPIGTPDIFIPLESEVNILSLTSTTGGVSVLGSDNAQSLKLASGFNNGWGVMNFVGYSLESLRYTEYWTDAPVDAGIVSGVPIAGFMAAIAEIGEHSVGETFPHVHMRSRELATVAE